MIVEGVDMQAGGGQKRQSVFHSVTDGRGFLLSDDSTLLLLNNFLSRLHHETWCKPDRAKWPGQRTTLSLRGQHLDTLFMSSLEKVCMYECSNCKACRIVAFLMSQLFP